MPSRRKKPPKLCPERYETDRRHHSSRRPHLDLTPSELERLADEDDDASYDYWREELARGGQLVLQRPGEIEYENDDDFPVRIRRRGRSRRRPSRNASSGRSNSEISNSTDRKCIFPEDCDLSTSTKNHSIHTGQFSDDDVNFDTVSVRNPSSHSALSELCRFPSDCLVSPKKAKSPLVEDYTISAEPSARSQSNPSRNNSLVSSTVDSSAFVCNYPKAELICNYPKKTEKRRKKSKSRKKNSEKNVCRYPSKRKPSVDKVSRSSSSVSSSSAGSGQGDDSSSIIENKKKKRKKKHREPSTNSEEEAADGVSSVKNSSSREAKQPRRRRRRRSQKSSILRKRNRGGSTRSPSSSYESIENDKSRKNVKFNAMSEIHKQTVTLSNRFWQCFGVANVASTNKLYWCLFLGILITVLWFRILFRVWQKTGITVWLQVAIYWMYWVNVTSVLFNLYEKIMTTIECDCRRLPNFFLYLLSLLGGAPGNAFSLLLFHYKDRSISYQNRFLFVIFLHVGLLWYAYRRVLNL